MSYLSEVPIPAQCGPTATFKSDFQSQRLSLHITQVKPLAFPPCAAPHLPATRHSLLFAVGGCGRRCSL